MTTIIRYHDPQFHMLGLSGLIDMPAACVLSIETADQADDTYLPDDAAVLAMADDFVRQRLNAMILEARFASVHDGETRHLCQYVDNGLTVFLTFAPEGDHPPYRVMRLTAPQVYDAPRYASWHEAQRAFDALVRPRLNSRSVERTVSAALSFLNNSASPSDKTGGGS